ncbi:MAG TPA: urease accessory protein UreE [Micropepsaceae bacterium]|nr:urease accessory protein UreE [Micropepsaceae bacterium]
MLRGIEIVKAPHGPFVDEVVLDHKDRHRRRMMLCGCAGVEFLLDLAEVPDLRGGDGIALSSGGIVRVRAADEPLMEIRCSNPAQLARIAWHIGNRHLPAEIGDGALRLRADHVIADMIEGLGGEVHHLNGPFNPEGGAYAHRAGTPAHDLDSHAQFRRHDHG